MDKLDDVWTSRDLPVLREVTRLIDSDLNPHPSVDEIAAALSMDQHTVRLAIKALTVRGLVKPAGAMADQSACWESAARLTSSPDCTPAGRTSASAS